MTQHGRDQQSSQPRSGRFRLNLIVGGLCVITACVLIKCCWGDKAVKADSLSQPDASSEPASTPSSVQRAWFGGSSAAPAPARTVVIPTSAVAPANKGVVPPISSSRPIPPIVASVNGRTISCEQLGRECILHHGKEVLDSMINRLLIVQECRRQHVTITRADVDHEIERLATRFGLPVDQWLTLLKQQRGIDVEQYASEIVWPRLALCRLAAPRLKVSPEELRQCFERRYGAKVAARLIACSDPRLAAKLRTQAAAHPEDFANLAKQYSEDVNSASIGGRIQPIPQHGVCQEIEQAAFSMADGEVSKVIFAAGQYAIIKREKLVPPERVRLQDVAPSLEEILREQKMRVVASEVFDDLKKQAVIAVLMENLEKQRQMPGVAAVINGVQITVRQLAEECIARHGTDVLEGLIGRELIEQACREHNVTVSEQELDAEVARVASVMLPLLRDGARRPGLPQVGCREEGHFRGRLSPRRRLALGRLAEAGPRQDSNHRRGPEKRLRGELRSAGEVPSHRGGPTPPCPAGLATGPQTAHGRALRRPGRRVFHRGQQPLAARRGAADRQTRRTTDAGTRGLRLETGRDSPASFNWATST